MSLTGDFAKLGLLKANLSRLSRVPAQTAAAVSTDIAVEIEKEFDAGQDPYGRAWEALRPATLRRGRRPPPLTDTGHLRSSVRVAPTAGAGIAIVIGAEYARFHQTGTVNMAARPILPAGGFPASWSQAIKRAAENQFGEAVK